MDKLRFSLVIPTYNEADGIERLIRSLGELFASNGLDGEIIVVDDNSPDGTGAIVDRLASAFPVRCLHRAGKLGLSSGVIEGWRFARPQSVALGAMDADFSHDVNIFPRMVHALEEGYGLAVGSRYVEGGGITNWPMKRIVTSKVACMLAQPLTRTWASGITLLGYALERERLPADDFLRVALFWR
ncbi:MAG: glycosyltransferase, partial [Candidatus Baltobacteraceae bacterium]